MQDYQQGRVQPIESNFVVEWTVKGSDGQTDQRDAPLTDSKVAFAAPNVAGALQVEALIKDRGQVLARQSGDPIAVATYTPVPTPTPMATPTPELCRGDGQVQRQRALRAGHRLWQGRHAEGRRDLSRQRPERDAGWWQISFDGKDAWVSGDLVDVNGPTETVAVVQVAPPPTAVPVAAKPGAGSGGRSQRRAAASYAAAPRQFRLRHADRPELERAGAVAARSRAWASTG